MKKQQYSETFRRAAWDALADRFSDVPPEEEIDVSFSPAFEQRMEQLCRKTQHSSWYLVNTARKRLLVALIALLLLAATACAAIPSLRKGLIRFFVRDYGAAFSLEFSQEDIDRAPEKIETPRTLDWIPEGLTEITNNVDTGGITQAYQDSEGYLFMYRQMTIWAINPEADAKGLPTQMGIDLEGAEMETIVLDGYEVLAVHYDPEEPENPTGYFWTDHEYLYYLEIQNQDIADVKDVERILNGIMDGE